jgi:protease-4
MFTGTHDYNKTEWARFESWLNRVYEDFTSKVADGRKLPKEKVLEIAKGRIWTGADAKELGLVDELGGFDTALKLTKKAIGVSESDEVKIVVFPHRKRPIELLLARAGADSSENEAATRALTDVLRVAQPVVKRAEAVGLIKEDQAEDVLRMEAMEMQR